MSHPSSSHAALDAALRKRGVYDRAREVLREYAATTLGGAPSLPDALPADVFDALAQAGLVDTLLNAAREEGISLDAATFDLLRRGGADSSAVPGGDAPEVAPAGPEAASDSPPPPRAAPLDPNRRYLRISLGRGRAFLSHLEPGLSWRGLDVEDDADGDAETTSLDRFYVLHVCIAGQRFRSAPVRATVEPAFDGSSTRAGGPVGGIGDFLVDVTPGDSGSVSLPSLGALLSSGARGAAAAHFVLVLVAHSKSPTGESGGVVRSDVVGTGLLDWRGALSEPDGVVKSLLPMMPPGPVPALPTARRAASSAAAEGTADDTAGAGTTQRSHAPSPEASPVGLLPITLALLPAPGGGALSRAEVSRALSAEAARDADASSAFLAYAQAWWSEYRSIHSTFRRRLVRIFGEGGESGGRFVPVVSRVAPLLADRLLDSPGAAARFVSLLPARLDDSDFAVGGPAAGGGASAWRAPHTVLAARAGSPQDRAVLLCSLLLGFGLDAFVCVGTRDAAADDESAAPAEEEYAWVLTRYTSSSAEGGFRVIFWDPATGSRIAPPTALGTDARQAARCPYARIACIFSGDRFFAVTAGDDTTGYLNVKSGWAFEDAAGAAWKAMEPALLMALPHSPSPPLAPPSLPAADVAVALEASLLRSLTAARATSDRMAALGRARAALAHAAGDASIDPKDAASLPAHATPVSLKLSALLGQALVSYEAVRGARNNDGIPLPSRFF